MTVRLALVFIAACAVASLSAKDIPDYLHVCSRSDPHLSECLKSSVESLRDKLITGLPEIGLPSIEPLIITEPISTQGVGLSVTTKDLKAFGGGNFTIKSMEADLAAMKYWFVLEFGHLSIEGHYDVEGKIIMIPIKGDGDLSCDVYDIEATVEVGSKLENVNGRDELRFTSIAIDVTVGNGKIYLGNLFGGDKVIGDMINSAINLNFQYFIKELKPIIQETLSQFTIKTANSIVAGFSFDQLYPA